jgi:hypothetical protein
MNIARVIKENKVSLIVIFVLWLILAIIFVAPLAYAISYAGQSGAFDFTLFIETFISSLISFTAITKVFTALTAGTFFKTLGIFTVIYAIFAAIGFFRTREKGDYYNIEHGSSDWSQNGEQYRILSKSKGIILAENNYLPVDKRGNVNVLVVGRFRFW